MQVRQTGRGRNGNGRFIGTAWRMGVALLPLLLCGCHDSDTPIDPMAQYGLGEEKKIEHVSNTPTAPPRVDLLTGRTLPALSGDHTPVSPLAGIGSNRPRTEVDETLPEAGYQGPLAYYMAKCDIYWKLNWIRKQITSDKIPAKLDKYIARTRRENRAARQDGNAQVAEEALDRLDAGLQHWRVLKALQSVGVRTMGIPWTTGDTGVQAYIDNGGFSFGAKSASTSFAPSRPSASFGDDDDDTTPATPSVSAGTTPTPLTPEQQEAIKLALSHAARYHAAPDLLAQSEWQKAIEQINRLGNQLYMNNRAENNDSASARVDAAMLRHAANLSGIESGITAEDFGADTPDGQAFQRALHEPGDPFGDKLP